MKKEVGLTLELPTVEQEVDLTVLELPAVEQEVDLLVLEHLDYEWTVG